MAATPTTPSPRLRGEGKGEGQRRVRRNGMTDTTKFPPEKNFPAGYVPPKVWSNDTASGGAFASINRPIAGPTHEKALPVGKHPLQLHSLGTPNGVKVTILLEELL